MMRRHLWSRVIAFPALLALALSTGGRPAIAAEEEKDDDAEHYVVFTKDHPLGETLPDQALVYVVRPTSMGYAIKSFFFCDDEIRGINRGSSYFFFHVAPGKHVMWSKSENVDALELEAQAGQTYYLQQRVQMGGFRARTKLEALSKAEGEEALGKCKKHGTITDKGRDQGKEYAATLKPNVQEDLERRAREAAEEKKK